MFVTIFYDTYENPRGKNFINPSCPKHPKIIEIKNDMFFFTLICGASKRPEGLHKIFLMHQKKCENKKFRSFFPLIQDWDDKG